MEPITSHPDAFEPQSRITIIVSNISGGRDLVFTLPPTSPVSEIYDELATRAPWVLNSRIVLTTNSRLNLGPHRSSPITTLLTTPTDSSSGENESATFLPLRLTIPLCGGKGGFGSQLRAQGGRMASRKKRNAGEANSSSRNLEGRRIRTVNEAKHLAEYLAAQPELERKEQEERRQRLQDIIDASERKEHELRTGKHVRIDGRWAEEKEEAENKTREAVLKALEGLPQAEAEDVGGVGPSSSSSSSMAKTSMAPRAMFGWEDEDEEFMSDSDDEEEVSEEDVKVEFEGKGKGKLAV